MILQHFFHVRPNADANIESERRRGNGKNYLNWGIAMIMPDMSGSGRNSDAVSLAEGEMPGIHFQFYRFTRVKKSDLLPGMASGGRV